MPLVAVAVWLLASGAIPALPQEARPPASKETLRGVEQAIERSTFEQRRLNYEIENLTEEAKRLRADLIELAEKVRLAEESAAVAASRAGDLAAREAALRRSLVAREKVTGEVLAAMQRIGRKPPPAVLVAPEDVMQAVRAAILLGNVVPALRADALALVADLEALARVRLQSGQAMATLTRERDTLASERARLAGLVDARQRQLGASQAELEVERGRLASLARDAKSLRDLISRSESENVGAARAAEIARRAPPPTRGQEVAALKPDLGGREVARLQPRRAFAEAKGAVRLPVSGMIARRFGEPDGVGGTETGTTIEAGEGALVTAPADGWIHFAGPYRGYGQLLIMNAGGGYHLVLAGLARLNVEIGQFVLAGEPLGFLGGGLPLQAVEGIASKLPALYVEFRKDGSPIDPSPFWSQTSAEKARG